jgi:hypothetical protein
MNKEQKYTSLIVDQFRHELLNRRKQCYEILDSLDELQYTTIELMTQEIDRIDAIFKLIQKNKI